MLVEFYASVLILDPLHKFPSWNFPESSNRKGQLKKICTNSHKRVFCGCRRNFFQRPLKGCQRQHQAGHPTPSLDLTLVILTFLHHGTEKVAYECLWKLHKKNSKKKFIKCVAKDACLYWFSVRSWTQNCSPVSESLFSIAQQKHLGISTWNAHLFIFMSTKFSPRIYDPFKVKKNQAFFILKIS